MPVFSIITKQIHKISLFLAESISPDDNPHVTSKQLLSLNPKFEKYSVGRFSYATKPPNIIKNLGDANLKIGSFCCFAPGVTILLGGET